MKLLGKIEQAQDAVSKEYVDGLVEPGGGGGDTGELEEVSAAGLVDLNERLLQLMSYCISKEKLTQVQQELTDALLDDEEVLAAALTNHEERIGNLEKRFGDYITRYENSLQTAKLISEIEADEKILAYAISDLAATLEDHKRRIYNLEKKS